MNYKSSNFSLLVVKNSRMRKPSPYVFETFQIFILVYYQDLIEGPFDKTI